MVDEAEAQRVGEPAEALQVPYPFANAAGLLEQGNVSKKRIAEMMRANELALRSPDQVRSGLLERWAVMNESIERGMHREGVLPGGLNERRRAKGLRDALLARRALKDKSASESMD